MEKEKFRLWAQSLGLKTGAELEKRIEFQNAKPEEDATLDKGDLAPNFVVTQEDDFYYLPENYSNKYNLIRGDFPPLELADAFNTSLDKYGSVDIEYISSLCLLSLKDVIISLGSKIYRDPKFEGEPFYKGWVCEEEYLL